MIYIILQNIKEYAREVSSLDKYTFEIIGLEFKLFLELL